MGVCEGQTNLRKGGFRRLVRPRSGRDLAQHHQCRGDANAGSCDLRTCPPYAQQGADDGGGGGRQ
jgi:hypothetical protein